MFDFIPGLKTLGYMALAACFVGIIAYAKGNVDGRDSERVRAVNAALQQIEQRNENNEAVRDLDACALIVELGGLPEHCPD